MRVIVDLDGVVFNFTDSLRLYLVQHCGRYEHELPDAKVWDFFIDQWGMTVEEFLDHCNAGVDAGVIFRQGPSWPGAVEGVQALKDRGHSVHILTDRSFGNLSPQNTIEWLKENEVPFDTITFSADKTILQADLLIEDRDRNYLAVEAAGNATPVLMTRPWNLDLVGARRVSDWPEFLELVDRWESYGTASAS